MTSNCPDCDLPLSTQEDHDRNPDATGDGLCWRYWWGDLCQEPPVDWRTRALEAESQLADVSKQLDEAHLTCAALVSERDGRDAAIDALTRRVAELMPCHDRVAFVDGELDAAKASAFRAHLRGCPGCRDRVVEDTQLAARLSTLGGKS